MHDAYAGMNRLYLSMHTPDAVRGMDMDDPVVSAWIDGNLSAGQSILDAGCGLGFDVLALHRGLPAKGGTPRFTVYGSDYSKDMLDDARKTGQTAGIPADRYHVSSFARLAAIDEWRERMDLVTVNYAIYTQPDETCDYNGYLDESLRGLRAVLRSGGHLAINLRDWVALKAADASGSKHSGEATHDGRTYYYEYSWEFGPARLHRTTLRMWEDEGTAHSTDIWFAERDETEMKAALRRARFEVVESGRHGEGAYAFQTLIARRV